MTKLEELIYSLATVIIRYHDSQPNVSQLVKELKPDVLRKKSREYAIRIIQNKNPTFDKHLTELINACTENYPNRKPFLIYILHNITYLKNQLDKNDPFSLQELEEYQSQIAKLFIDFRQLLKTPKSETYQITYRDPNSESSKAISSMGLLNNRWLGNPYCNSGLFVIEEVLGRFHITLEHTDTDEEISEIAASLCMENQNALCGVALQRQKSEWEEQKRVFDVEKAEFESQKLKLESQKLALESVKLHVEAQILELTSQKSVLEVQQQQLKSQKTSLNAEKHNVRTQKATLDVEKQHLGSQRSELEAQQSQLEIQRSELDIQKGEFTAKIQEQETTISGLEHDLEKIEEELTKTRSEFQEYKEIKQKEVHANNPYPDYSSFFGLGHLNTIGKRRGLMSPGALFSPSAAANMHQKNGPSSEEDENSALSLF